MYSTVTINWKKLFTFWDRGSIPRPHVGMPNALPIVLTCHSASISHLLLFVNLNNVILLYSYQQFKLSLLDWVGFCFKLLTDHHKADRNALSIQQWQLITEKTFHFLRPRIDPKTSCSNAQCITHCSNMSFCQLFLICFCLSIQILSYCCIVSRQP